MTMPHTFFSTEFRGGPAPLRRRLANLFAAPRRGPAAVVVPVVACVVLLSLFVSCGAPAPADSQPSALDGDALARAAILASGQDGWDPDGTYATWDYLLNEASGGVQACALRFDSGVHAGGFGNLLLFTADPATGAILGNVRVLSGDEADLAAWTPGGGPLHILCATVTTYQGVQTCGGGEFLLDGENWSLVWPKEPDTDGYDLFWADRKGVLTPGGMDLYTRAGTSDVGQTPQWTFERTENRYGLPEGVGLARAYVQSVVPEHARHNALFQVTACTPAGRYPAPDGQSVAAYQVAYRYQDDDNQTVEVSDAAPIYTYYAPAAAGLPLESYYLGSSTDPDAQAAARRLSALHTYPLGDWTLPVTDSAPYAEKDIATAMEAAKTYFDGLENDRLDALWFDPVQSLRVRGLYLRGGGGVAEENVMVLHCDWTWLGPDGPVDHGEAREGWNLIFTRASADAPWVLADQGY